MNTRILLPLVALAVAGAQAHAQAQAPSQAQDGHAKPAAVAASAAPLAKPKRDPQAYFSDRELYTQDGRKVRFYSDVLKGRTVVINTIYTNCQDACPLITAQMSQVRAKLGASFGKDIYFVTLSTDPARDSPQAMKKYAAKHSADVPGWLFLTGKAADLEFILKRLGQWSQNVESHATHLIAWNFVADRGRKLMPNLPPDLIAAQLMMLVDSDALVPIPAAAPAKGN